MSNDIFKKPFQEKLSEDSRRCKEGMEKIRTLADEDSRSESSSTEEEKEKTKLLLERLKALEVRSTTVLHIKDPPSPCLIHLLAMNHPVVLI